MQGEKLIYLDNVPMMVQYYYTKYISAKYPDSPDEGGSFEIESVKIEEYEVYSLLGDYTLQRLETIIIKEMEEF